MSYSANRSQWSRSAALVGLVVALGSFVLAGLAITAASAAQDAEVDALLGRIRDAMASSGSTRFVMPLPGSRSIVLAIDTTTPLYFFLERGSIRGSSIDEFYTHLEGGDTEAAYKVFMRNALMTVRAIDYGWNGLGQPMLTDSGAEISDLYYRDAGGVFRRIVDISSADIANYKELLQTIATGLDGGT